VGIDNIPLRTVNRCSTIAKSTIIDKAKERNWHEVQENGAEGKKM